jgi:hypothetical protein
VHTPYAPSHIGVDEWLSNNDTLVFVVRACKFDLAFIPMVKPTEAGFNSAGQRKRRKKRPPTADKALDSNFLATISCRILQPSHSDLQTTEHVGIAIIAVILGNIAILGAATKRIINVCKCFFETCNQIASILNLIFSR